MTASTSDVATFSPFHLENLSEKNYLKVSNCWYVGRKCRDKKLTLLPERISRSVFKAEISVSVHNENVAAVEILVSFRENVS